MRIQSKLELVVPLSEYIKLPVLQIFLNKMAKNIDIKLILASKAVSYKLLTTGPKTQKFRVMFKISQEGKAETDK